MGNGVFGGGRLDGVRILVVEDERDSREVIVALLEMCGARPASAADGDAGFDAFLRERPAVVLTDLWMPKASGYDLIRRVRALAPEDGGITPAIAMTASAVDTEERVLAAGFHAHFSKPMDATALVAMLTSFADVASETDLPEAAARWTVVCPAPERIVVTYTGHVTIKDVRDSLAIAALRLEKQRATIYMDARRIAGFDIAVGYAAQQSVWRVRDRIERVVLAATSGRVRLVASAACSIVGVALELVKELPEGARG